MRKRKKARTGGGPVFFFKEGITNIFVNGFMSFAAVSIIMICLMIVGGFGLTALNAQQAISEIIDESQILIFIEDDYTGAYAQIQASLNEIEDVKEVVYVSKSTALENYKESLGEEGALLLQGFENDNPLRDGYTIYLNSLDNIDTVTEQINQINGIDTVQSKNDTYKALNNIDRGLQIMSIVFIITFGCLSIFIIQNTVKLAMLARRDEISIMKMIGATNAFIRWPFVVEGLILGILSAGLAYGATWFMYAELIAFTSDFIGFVDIIPFSTIQWVTLWLYLGAGTLIGVTGSSTTIKKFMDV